MLHGCWKKWITSKVCSMRCMIFFLLLAPLSTIADTVVIYSNDKNTRSIHSQMIDSKLFKIKRQEISSEKIIESLVKSSKNNKLIKNASWVVGYPVKTKLMFFGVFHSYEVDYPNVETPFCVIGSDSGSLNWLRRNREKLISIGAYCYLVSAETKEDGARVEAVAGDALHILPMTGDGISAIYGLKKYPAVVTKKFIIQ